MDDLELKMANKSDEIDVANVKLKEAEKVQAAQYDDMKLRIKYMYEDQSVSLAEVFLTSSDMSTMLNKAVYMQEVYNYDRNKLDEMANTAQEIQNLKTDFLPRSLSSTQILKNRHGIQCSSSACGF